jgi:hypothetical protein
MHINYFLIHIFGLIKGSRTIAALIFCLTLTSFSFAQEKASASELYIIGNIHTGNKNIHVDTLYQVLKKHQPDVVLWEYHQNLKPVFGLTTANRLGIAKVKGRLEQFALQKYLRKSKQKMAFGYDTAFDRKKYIAESANFEYLFF